MKWTPELDQSVAAMKANGIDTQAIADALGVSRSSVKGRLRYLSLSPEQRRVESKASHADRKPEERKLVRERVTPAHVHFVPSEVLADRERRMLADQPAFGDPPRGFSALDRKQSGAGA